MEFKGDKLRELRLENDLSIRDLAAISGTSKSQISDLENNVTKNTTIETLCKIAKALNAKAEDFFTC